MSIPEPAACGHLTHLRRGSNNYGWDADRDVWDECAIPRPVRRKPQPETVDVLTVPEVAESLRVSRMSVYRLVESGVLTSVRVGRSIRIPTRALADYLRQQTDGAA